MIKRVTRYFSVLKLNKMLEAYTKAGLTISREGPIQIIKFDNVSVKNAISTEAYKVIKNVLKEATEDDSVVATVLTGAGSYYSSGFNISSSINTQSSFDEDGIRKNVDDLRDFIGALIDYPKLLIALVNGPAFGIAVTTLGLCDVVYAIDNATFKTPFTKLGVCAEGCSSYTFPIILGTSKANQMLLLNHEMSANEALQYGFISKIYKSSEKDKIWNEIKSYGNISSTSLQVNKRLIKRFRVDKLHSVNKVETDELVNRFLSEDFMNGVMEFMTRKNKSKL